MGTKFVPAAFEGAVVWDPRFSSELGADTVAIFNGGEPDQPQALSGSYGALEATGTADGAISDTFYATVMRAGLPVPGGTSARTKWSTDNTSATERGWLPPKVMVGFEWLKYNAAGGYTNVHAITLKSHKVLAAYVDATGSQTVKTMRRSTAGVWSDTGNVVVGGNVLPKLVELPDGRVLCIVQNATSYSGTTYRTVDVYASDDEGSTWTLVVEVADGILLDTGDYTSFINASVCYHNGYLTYVTTALNTVYRFLHYISSDLGASWTLVEDYDTRSSYAHSVVTTDSGDVLMLYISTNTGASINQCLCYGRKGSPAGRFQDDPGFELSTNAIDGAAALDLEYDDASDVANIAVGMDQDHTLWVAGRRCHTTAAQRSQRIGLTRYNPATMAKIFSPWGDEAAHPDPIDLGDPNSGYQAPAALVPHMGSLLLIGGAETVDTTGSIHMCKLGDYSNVDWNGNTFGFYRTSTRYGLAYFPIQLPSTIAAWTTTGAGAEAITSDGLVLNFSGGAQYKNYTRAGGAGTPCFIMAQHAMVTGGSLSAANAFIRVGNANGVFDYDVRLNFSQTGARLVDLNNAGATIGTDVSGLTANVVYDWILYLNGSRAAVYYKLPTATLWSSGPFGTAVDGGAGPLVNLAQWGNGESAATTTAHSKWRMANSSIDDFLATMSAFEPNNTRPTYGREVSIWPVWLADGTRTAGRGGPFYKGNAWQIDTRYEYGPDKFDLSRFASPRMETRITPSGAVTVEWETENDTDFGTQAVSVSLIRPNFKTAYFEYWTGAAWAAVCTIDCSSGLSGLTFDRTGDTVYPDAATAAGTRFLSQDELASDGETYAMGYCHMDDGAGTIEVRPIVAHTAGVWRASGSQLLSFRIGGDLTGVPTTGTLAIIFPLVCVVKFAHTVRSSKYRIRIASGTDTYEGYYRLKPLIGSFYPFGKPSSFGATDAMDPNQTVTTLDNGSQAIARRGPLVRTRNIPWSDVIPTNVGNASPDYIAAASGAGYTGLAVKKDPGVLEGLLRRAQGARYPLVYLPRVTTGSDTVTLTGRELTMYARIVNGVQRTEDRGVPGGRLDILTGLDLEEVV